MSTHNFEKLDWLVCIDDTCLHLDVAMQIGRMYWVSDVSFSAVQLMGLGEHWFDAAKFRKANYLEGTFPVALIKPKLNQNGKVT